MVKAGAADGVEYTEAELQGLLRRADLDADGDIDFYELTELLSRQKRLRKHVEEKYVGGLQQQQSKQQSSSFSNAVDPTTSRLASLTPIRVPARQPIQERLPPQTMMSHAYSRSAEESRRFYDDDRMARLSRAMNISDSPFRRRY